MKTLRQYFSRIPLVLALVAGGLARGGTFSANWDNAPVGLDGLTGSLPHDQFASLDDSNDLVNGLFIKSTESGSLSGKGVVSFNIVWQPSSSSEDAPPAADVTVQLDGNIFGPAGSSGSIVDESSTTLLSGLGSDGSYSSLRTATFTVDLAPNGDGSYEGFLQFPVDVLTSSGGATVRERATIISMAPHTMTLAKLKRRSSKMPTAQAAKNSKDISKANYAREVRWVPVVGFSALAASLFALRRKR